MNTVLDTNVNITETISELYAQLLKYERISNTLKDAKELNIIDDDMFAEQNEENIENIKTTVEKVKISYRINRCVHHSTHYGRNNSNCSHSFPMTQGDLFIIKTLLNMNSNETITSYKKCGYCKGFVSIERETTILVRGDVTAALSL